MTVYIREAHPRDGWWLGKGLFKWGLRLIGSRASTEIYDPKTMSERQQVAQHCCGSLAFDVPTLVDDMEDSVNQAYAAWPTRLYLVGTDGVVLYAGGLGPYGFSPRSLGAALARTV